MMSESFERKLRKLGVVKGVEGLERPPLIPKKTGPEPQDTLLPGREVETEYGTFWLDKRVFEPDFQHGTYQLSRLNFVREDQLGLFGVSHLGLTPAFVDTETTGLAGGAGTLAFLVGIGIWEGNALTIHLVFMRNPDEEEAALRYVAEVLDPCTGLVTFNGRAFDLPLLQTRFILNRLDPSWMDLPHLDLLPVARRLWRDYLPSRRLGEIEASILGIQRTEEDLPSYLIPYFYRQYLETGDTTEMRRVMYHNVIDVLSLVSLLIHVSDMVSQPEAMNLAAAEWAGVGSVFYQAGFTQRALDAWECALSSSHAGDLPESCTSRLYKEIGVYYKRRIQWDRALHVWDMWHQTVPHEVEPLIEQAKYYEWTAGDHTRALQITELAIKRVENHYEELEGLRVLEDLLHRRKRLTLKLVGGKEE
jgi:hypothetical protein